MNAQKTDKLVQKLLKKNTNEFEIMNILQQKGITDKMELFHIQQKVKEHYRYAELQTGVGSSFDLSRVLFRFAAGSIFLVLGLYGIAWKFGFILVNTHYVPRAGIILIGCPILIFVGLRLIFTCAKRSST